MPVANEPSSLSYGPVHSGSKPSIKPSSSSSMPFAQMQEPSHPSSSVVPPVLVAPPVLVVAPVPFSPPIARSPAEPLAPVPLAPVPPLPVSPLSPHAQIRVSGSNNTRQVLEILFMRSLLTENLSVGRKT